MIPKGLFRTTREISRWTNLEPRQTEAKSRQNCSFSQSPPCLPTLILVAWLVAIFWLLNGALFYLLFAYGSIAKGTSTP